MKGKEGGREEGMKGRKRKEERKMKEIQIQATLIIYYYLVFFFLRTKYNYSRISLVCVFVYTACTLTHAYLQKHA